MLLSGIANYWEQRVDHTLGNLIGTILRHDRKTTSYYAVISGFRVMIGIARVCRLG
jgi:hypothetical protein